MNKCLFGQHEITYLGYTISNGSLRTDPDPDRIKPLMSIPNDSSSLKQALVFFSYYSISD